MASGWEVVETKPSAGTGGGWEVVKQAPSTIDPLTGQPFQYAGPVPEGDPVGQSTGQPIEEGRAPGAAVQAAGSLPTDPEQKRRIIASQLFPNLEPQVAQSRVFYGTNGRMAAVGLDGRPYYVDPEAPNFSALRTFSPSNLVANAATLAGPALPLAGGMAGLATAPTSMFAGPIVAAAGAAAGDAARQTLAGKLDPQSERTPYNVRQTAGEAVGAGAGQFAGASALRLFAPNPLGLSYADIRRIGNDKNLMGEANRLYRQAEAQGVRLTPGQATGLPSLLASEDAIASGSVRPELQDLAAVRYQGQREDVGRAYQSYLDHVSPAADKTDAAMQFQQGAEDAQRLVRQQANAAARPSYDAAKAGGQVMSPDLAQLAELPAVQSALRKAAEDYHNRTGQVPNIGTPDFELWNIAKTKLDDAITAAKMKGQRARADALDDVRVRLLANLDTAYPDYAKARELAAPGQRQAARMESAMGGPGTGTETARQVTASVFDSNNPRTIAEMRQSFYDTGRGAEWDAGVRARLQDLFDNTVKSQEGLNPAFLRRQVWSDPNRREAMQAAMSPQQFAGLNNIMETIEAVARSKGANSLTAPRTAGAAALKTAAADQPDVLIARTLGFLTSPSRLIGGLGPMFDKYEAMRTRQGLAGIAQGLFSESGMALLNNAGLMKPGSQKLITAISEVLGQQAGGTDTAAGRAPPPGVDLRAPRNQLMQF